MWLRQLEYECPLEAEDLKSMNGIEPTKADLDFLDGLARWVQGTVLERADLPYTFAMIGLERAILVSLLGEAATTKLVGAGPSPADVVSMQMRQILIYQMSQLAGSLSRAREAGDLTGQGYAKEALKKHLPNLRKKVLKKTKAKSTTDGRDVPLGDEEKDDL